jgi:hypothetical protein
MVTQTDLQINGELKMDKQTYNGWTNYETWLANLWMGNDTGTYEHFLEMARECVAKHSTERLYGEDSYNDAEIELAHKIQTFHEDEASSAVEPTIGLMHDLLYAALKQVEWREIAKSIIDSLE